MCRNNYGKFHLPGSNGHTINSISQTDFFSGEVYEIEKKWQQQVN
jgi:hypothetical protein